ncbi:MAG: HAD-IIB family hydrolase [Clostridia bacterium]|nr:HAD-IIB family hydrolase [Clostridia bacterium]
MYKFVAIDIDGTLLRSNGELSEKNKNIIKRVIDNGVRVVLTSGRATGSVKNIAKQLNVDRYMICDNGASIYDIKENQIVTAKYIDKDTVLHIVDTCIQNNIYYMVFTTKEIIVKDLKHMALAFYKKRHNLNNEISGSSEIKYAGKDYIEQVKEPFIRIVVCDQDRPVYNSIVNRLKKYDSIELMAPPHISNKLINDGEKNILISYSYAELLPKNVNKWSAIETLIHQFHIKPNEVIAIRR